MKDRIKKKETKLIEVKKKRKIDTGSPWNKTKKLKAQHKYVNCIRVISPHRKRLI